MFCQLDTAFRPYVLIGLSGWHLVWADYMFMESDQGCVFVCLKQRVLCKFNRRQTFMLLVSSAFSVTDTIWWVFYGSQLKYAPAFRNSLLTSEIFRGPLGDSSLCCHHFVAILIRAKQYFSWIWILSENSPVTWIPAPCPSPSLGMSVCSLAVNYGQDLHQGVAELAVTFLLLDWFTVPTWWL